VSEINQTLLNWKNSLCHKVELASVFARNPTAYKWKAPYRSLILRESVFWRTHDPLTQAQTLFEAGHILGSRILTRSAFETVATLIYLNQSTANVLAGTEDFHDFSIKTSKLLLGSRDKSTKHAAINILNVLRQCEKKYHGLTDVYNSLSESAHPNFEGTCFGYSRVDHNKHETNFSNNWADMYADRHLLSMKLCIVIFEAEYNDVWTPQIEKLEAWLVANDAALEATKGEGDLLP
jgi:hypothetical protein